MSGTSITINAEQVKAEILQVAERIGHAKPAFKIIGETVKASVLKNFQYGGRPGWTALSAATLKTKKGGSILVGQGNAGGLMGSINADAFDDHVLIGPDQRKYAAIHQFGGMAGRNRKVKIPARPYLLVQESDWPIMKEQLQDYLLTGKV